MIADILGRHPVVGFDTSPFIYHFEAHPDFAPLTTSILKTIQSGTCRGIVSDISLLEVLVLPLRQERQDIADEYEVLLTNFPNLSLVPVSRETILRGASIRALSGLNTPDALIVATAIEHGATLVITNDQQWKKVKGIEVVCLDDLLHG